MAFAACGVEVDRGDNDGNNQMSSLRFEMGGIDVEAYRAYCLSLGDEFSPLVEGYFWESAMVVGKNFKLEPLFQRAVADGVLLPEDLVYYQCFSLPSRPGCLAFNCPHLSRLKNNADPEARSHAIVDGHRMIRRLVAFLTGYMPGFEHAYLLREASVLGVRESWRIRGLYQLTEDDYLARARFEDAVAKGDWYIDVHSATKGLVHMDKFEHGEYYEIPYRCLVNERIANMMTIGRCISTTFLGAGEYPHPTHAHRHGPCRRCGVCPRTPRRRGAQRVFGHRAHDALTPERRFRLRIRNRNRLSNTHLQPLITHKRPFASLFRISK